MGISLDLTGVWTYRSFHNDPDPAIDSRWFIAELSLDQAPNGALKGFLKAEDLKYQYGVGGWLKGDQIELKAVGTTPDTQGHEYDYRGYYQGLWANGVNQLPCFSGSIIRAKRPDDPTKEGKVGSFTAVKRLSRFRT